ncbi:cysteine desulfurase [Candidatus Uhrbacteria bacterium]|nr:cysteine desulfurase [Candidatus Uhrbacteria bacterium]
MATPWSKARADFPLYTNGRRKIAYLDSAASSLTPEPVLAAMDAYYRECRANVHRGMYAESEDAGARYDGAREKIAAFLRAAADEIVFTRGTTESLNLLAYSLSRKLGPGDEVVISIMEHHANLVPWQQLAKERGFALEFIPLAADLTLDMRAARALITPKTKIVSVTYASNVLGTVVPVRELADLAHAVGAVMIVDAAQAAGHRPIDVRELDCDFLALSGHKMLGPTGIGVLYGKRGRLEALPPFMFGGDMILDVRKEDSLWNEVPYKFEAGTPNIAGAIGLGAAIDYLGKLGLDAVRSHEREITDYALAALAKIPGVTVYGPPSGSDRAGLVSFTIEGVHPHDAATVFDRQGVCVRGGHHCAMPLLRELGLNGTLRASFGVYTAPEDVDALVAAIIKTKAIFNV